MTPSKKPVKMDLGEAYLKAQQLKIESVATAASSKQRSDFIVALMLQGKTTAEVEVLLRLAGL